MHSHPQDVITYFDAGVPNITGFFVTDLSFNPLYSSESSALYFDGWTSGNSGFGDGVGSDNIERFDASRCSKVYGRSTTVQPASITINYFIRAK